MRKVLIASHSKLAEGFVSAARLICGKVPNVEYINAYMDDSSLDEMLNRYFLEVGKEDEIIVITDLINGSVNTKCVEYIKSHNIKLISGANLSLVLSVLMESDSTPLTDQAIENLVAESQTQIKYINTVLKTQNNESNLDDFDV